MTSEVPSVPSENEMFRLDIQSMRSVVCSG
jgi:hypothetical protein